MLFEKDEDPELQPKRTKTLLISVAIHALFLVFLALNPDFLTSTPKRIIKVITSVRVGGLSFQSFIARSELVAPHQVTRLEPAGREGSPDGRGTGS